MCPGNLISDANGEYCICVVFESQSIGTFNQLVMFDFGSEPVLVRELKVSMNTSPGSQKKGVHTAKNGAH